jgi:hypothetical protein
LVARRMKEFVGIRSSSGRYQVERLGSSTHLAL